MMSPVAKFVLLSTLAGGIVASSSPTATALGTRGLASDSTSIPTISTSSSTYKIPFKTGHGPVVISTSVPALTLHDPKLNTPTVVSDALIPSPTYESASYHNIWSTNEHQPERTLRPRIPGEFRSREGRIEGITIDTMYDTDCHGDNGDAHIHFTIAYTNGTIAYDPRGRPGLFSFTTPWYISYPKTLRKAIFNDPTSYRSKQKSEDCKHGHCFSEVLPGLLYNNEPVKLKRVKNPKTLRMSSKTFDIDRDYFALGECHYDDSLLDIWRMGVYLGRIGYYIHGANIPPAVIDYVEDRVRTTYPTLEICLILWGTLGAIPTLIFVFILLVYIVIMAAALHHNVPQMWASAKRGREAMWKAIILAPGKGWDAVKGRWKRGFRRQRSVVAPPNTVQSTADEQLPDYELPEWTPSELARPPSYRTYDGGCEGFNNV